MLDSYRLVGDPAALERDGLFVAEGRLVVERLLLDGRFRVHSVAVTPPAAAALARVFERRPDVPVHVCDPDALRAITGFDFHRGCLALAWRSGADVSIDSLTDSATLLAIEGVGNPDNVGGLFRTAFALGAGGVVLDLATADPLYRKSIRTSMAATLRLPFARAARWPEDLELLRRSGFSVVALTPHPDAVELSQLSVARGNRIVLAVGSEGDGLSDEALRHADLRVRVPVDPRADSLNVVVAAGIALNALRHRT